MIFENRGSIEKNKRNNELIYGSIFENYEYLLKNARI
jgi:hypothetical protein